MDKIVAIPRKHPRNTIDWKNIKISFILTKKNHTNPLNPNGKLNQEERNNRIIELSAQILRSSKG